MNNMNVNVNPSPYVKPTLNVTNLQIRVQNLVLFTSVTINVILMGANNEFIDSVSYTLSGTDYTSWNNDDTYIVDYVLTQLGLTQVQNTNNGLTQLGLTQLGLTQVTVIETAQITDNGLTQVPVVETA